MQCQSYTDEVVIIRYGHFRFHAHTQGCANDNLQVIKVIKSQILLAMSSILHMHLHVLLTFNLTSMQ